MGGSYQCHTCLREFSRSDSLRRHLGSGICKQNEDDEQNEEAPSENSESQEDDDDRFSSEEDEIPQSQSKMTKSEPWDRIMETVYDILQDTFDDTCETYLEQNQGMEITEADQKAFDELKSNYRQALISQYHDLTYKCEIS